VANNHIRANIGRIRFTSKLVTFASTLRQLPHFETDLRRFPGVRAASLRVSVVFVAFVVL
jgi:hypothetical protein